MKQQINVYKPRGMTPLQVISLVREKFSEYKNVKMGYAGRLDPLAHGVLLLMIDEETKHRDKYLNLPKEYEFEVVFGISTDTYDALGILDSKFETLSTKSETNSNNQNKNAKNVLNLKNSNFDIVSKFDIRISDLNEFITNKLGKQIQTYPPFSSKTVNGKPLYWWARNNKLSKIEIPKREIKIYDFKLLGLKEISTGKLKKEIMEQINSVQGDFRQKEIKEGWEEFFITHSLTVIPAKAEIQKRKAKKMDSWFAARNDSIQNVHSFPTARFKISCSSGTYVRSLVNELGQKLNYGAITLEILRTKVGNHSIKESLILQK